MEKRWTGHADRCHQPTRPTHAEDAHVPGLMVALGVLSALACAGFWPGQRLPMLGVSLAVGLLLFPVATITLPPYVSWMIPVLSLTGGALRCGFPGEGKDEQREQFKSGDMKAKATQRPRPHTRRIQSISTGITTRR